MAFCGCGRTLTGIMNAVAIIPARYGSKRLPGKVLLDRTGKPLVQHVVESIRSAASIERVVVATDDDRVAEAVSAFGGQAVLTNADCRNGTERIAEAAEKLDLPDETIVVNVQGDEPEMPPECVDKVVELLAGSDAAVATLAAPMSEAEAELPNMTKVVFDANGRAMYFSRAKIPCDRDDVGGVRYFLHHGIYAYSAAFLRIYRSLTPTPAEQAEKLEQLRVLENGYKIVVGVVDYRPSRIDTPQEYEQFVAKVASQQGRTPR